MRRLFKADVDAGQEAPPREGAGDMLRVAREARGLLLPDVASMLRIRLPYLQAIEDGRYADLPGAAYVSGFLRSYAEHVGLEPDVIVRRYKEEAVGRDTRQELYLPTPAAEGRMPGGALLFGALVLAGAVYGAWYYASATDRSLVDLTPALPERFVALLEGLPWRSAGPGADNPAAAEVPPPSPPSSVSPPSSAPPSSAASPSPAGPAGGAVVATSPSPAPSTRAAAPSPAPTTSAPTTSAVTPSTGQPPREEPEEEVEGSAQEPTPLAPGASPLSPPPEAPPPAIDPTVASKVYGASNGGSRIQLRATQDSWLQVRERSGEILFTRTLKPGEVYRVPDRPGLRVRTGNAGGLTVITDGVPGAPMGAVGQVLRDVPLDSPSLSGATN